jgi:hypothetical protein
MLTALGSCCCCALCHATKAGAGQGGPISEERTGATRAGPQLALLAKARPRYASHVIRGFDSWPCHFEGLGTLVVPTADHATLKGHFEHSAGELGGSKEHSS